MSEPIRDIKSLLRMATAQAEAAEGTHNNQHNQILYLSDKLNKVFHALRQFHSNHGRDLSPEVLDAFNAAWRNYEASFDTWQSYQKNESNFSLDTTFDLD